MELGPGSFDPDLRAYLKKFRAYQRWLDGGAFTPEAEEIRDMLAAERKGEEPKD